MFGEGGDAMGRGYIEYHFPESGRKECVFFSAFIDYRLADGSKLHFLQQPASCSICQRFVSAEEVPSIEELEEDIAEFRSGDPKLLQQWAFVSNGLPVENRIAELLRYMRGGRWEQWILYVLPGFVSDYRLIPLCPATLSKSGPELESLSRAENGSEHLLIGGARVQCVHKRRKTTRIGRPQQVRRVIELHQVGAVFLRSKEEGGNTEARFTRIQGRHPDYILRFTGVTIEHVLIYRGDEALIGAEV